MKIEFQGSEGRIHGFGFAFFNTVWFFLKSETKWHKGEKYRDKFIWKDQIKDDIPAVFIGKIAIGFKSFKEKEEEKEKEKEESP